MKLILASKSPRRREILENLGISFEIVTAETDESSEERDPCRLVEQLSRRKGEAVQELLWRQGRILDGTVILSSDTVVCVDGEILGKPRDATDARRMLRLLSGRAHEVVSGICLIGKDHICSSHEVTRVVFDALDEVGYSGSYNLEISPVHFGKNFQREEEEFAVKVMRNFLDTRYGK